jgi:hypothetical protein
MEKNVRDELDVLKEMLNNWKRGFLGWASPDGDNDHVLAEFTEEIQVHLYPYVRRLFEANHLTDSEADEFMSYCFDQVEDLRAKLSQAETDESRKEA